MPGGITVYYVWYLYPEEGVCIQVPEGEGEGLGELYAGWYLPLQQVLLVAIQVFSLLGRLAAQTEIDPSSHPEFYSM